MQTTLPLRQIADGVFAAPQLDEAAMAELARLGFKSVVNNRPDFEHGPDQPASARIEAAAKTVGIEYRHLPVAGGYQSPEEIAAFRTLVAELPHPMLAFCRSGARSTQLYHLSQAG
ncbi:MAG: TIGR01244 family sulfur transferase [Burkholderiaceae bacterium]